MRVTSFAVVLVSLSCAFLFRGISGGPPPKDEMSELAIFLPDKLKWQEGPPSLPKGAMIAVLEGDLTKEGPFTIRTKLPDGYRVPPHTHPKTEHLTVISGTLNVGMGDKFDEKASKAMPAGSFGYWPAGMKHFAWTKGETITQIHAEGPLVDPVRQPAGRPSQPEEEAVATPSLGNEWGALHRQVLALPFSCKSSGCSRAPPCHSKNFAL
jgi:quercetin dioxygenase-like cupin family protein